MNKLKEENLRRALSHIERHKQAINTSNNCEDNDFINYYSNLAMMYMKESRQIKNPIRI